MDDESISMIDERAVFEAARRQSPDELPHQAPVRRQRTLGRSQRDGRVVSCTLLHIHATYHFFSCTRGMVRECIRLLPTLQRRCDSEDWSASVLQRCECRHSSERLARSLATVIVRRSSSHRGDLQPVRWFLFRGDHPDDVRIRPGQSHLGRTAAEEASTFHAIHSCIFSISLMSSKSHTILSKNQALHRNATANPVIVIQKSRVYRPQRKGISPITWVAFSM